MSKRILEPPVIGIAAVYFFCFTLVLWPVTDFLTTVSPFRWGALEWRYGAAGIMAVYLITPILGLSFAAVLAFVLRHRITLRMLSGLCLLGAIFLILTLVSLGLDTTQIRNLAIPEGAPSLRLGGLVAAVKHVSALISLILIGIGGWQAATRMSTEPSGGAAERRGRWLGAERDAVDK